MNGVADDRRPVPCCSATARWLLLAQPPRSTSFRQRTQADLSGWLTGFSTLGRLDTTQCCRSLVGARRPLYRGAQLMACAAWSGLLSTSARRREVIGKSSK